MFENTITKARQQSEIQLTRHFKATSSFSVLQQRDDDQATENMLSSGEQSMDRSWLESQGVSYLFFFFFLLLLSLQINIAINVNDRGGKITKLEQRTG